MRQRSRKTARPRAGTIAAAIAWACLLALAPVAEAQDFSWQGAVASGRTVTIKGINGGIVARAAEGDRVVVDATKTAERDDPESVQIEVVEDGRGVLICAVYPSRDRDEPNRCARGHDYHMSTGRNDVKVDFVVEIPSGVEFEATTVNGSIGVSGVTAPVEATAVNGDITIETSGSAEAVTVNGSIDARLGAVDEDLEFTTVNGSIVVTLPPDAGADVEARTVNGRIESDFPITVRGRWGPRSAEGRIGGGGPSIEITTVNGSVELRRG